MTPTVTTYVERITIVLSHDGALKGAMQESLQTIADTSTSPPTPISAQMLPATGLDPAMLASILPNQAALTAQVQSLTTQLADAAAAATTAATALSAMTVARDAALVEVQSLQTAQTTPAPTDIAGAVSAEFTRRVNAVGLTPARLDSINIQLSLTLQAQMAGAHVGDPSLQQWQIYDMAVYATINAWQSTMIAAREKLIAAADLSTVSLDASWPAPIALPAGWLAGY